MKAPANPRSNRGVPTFFIVFFAETKKRCVYIPKKNHLIGAICTLTGMTIGAGILGIPYAISQSGFLIGIIMLLIVAAITLILNLYVGEICLRTKEDHQLTGLAEKYLGKNGKNWMSFAFLFGLNAAMIAYLIGGGRTISALFGIPELYASLIYFAILSLIVFFGIRYVERSETFFVALMVCVFITMTAYLFFSGSFSVENLQKIDASKALLPYGVLLFAFLGMAAIPEMKEELKENFHLMKKAIIFSLVLCATIYAVFAISTIGTMGAGTTEVATTGIGLKFGVYMLLIANIFATITLSTSFISICYALRETYTFDYNINSYVAFFMATLIPLAIFLLGAKNFILVIGITGVVTGAIKGVLVVMMHSKAIKHGERTPEYKIKDYAAINWIMILLLVMGLVLELLHIARVI